MSECETCRNNSNLEGFWNGEDKQCRLYAKYGDDCPLYIRSHKKKQPQTRYERIMAEMTVESLADLRTVCEERQDYPDDISVITYVNDAGRFHYHEDAIKAMIELLNSPDASDIV